MMVNYTICYTIIYTDSLYTDSQITENTHDTIESTQISQINISHIHKYSQITQYNHIIEDYTERRGREKRERLTVWN